MSTGGVNPSDGLVPWVLAGVASMIATLTSAVTFLARKIAHDNAVEIKELKDRSSACEKDRSELFAKHAVLEHEVNSLKTKLCSIDVNGTKYSHKERE